MLNGRRWAAFFWAILALETVWVLAQASKTAFFPYDLVNAYDANHLEAALRILEGDLRRLYVDPNDRGFILSSYTPLHFFILAAGVKIFGATVVLPRAISLVCFGLNILLIGIWFHRTRKPFFAAAGALLASNITLGFFGLPHFGTVDAPMMLLSTAAFAAGSLGRGRAGAVLTGCLAAAAFLTKQSAVFTGLALAIQYFLFRPRLVFPFLSAWILFAGVPLVILNHLNNGYLMFHTVHVPGKIIILDYAKLLFEGRVILWYAGWPLLLGTVAFLKNRRREEADTSSLLLSLVWLAGIFPMLAKDGTSCAYLAPAAPGIAGLAVGAWEWLWRLGRRRLSLFVVAVTLLAMPFEWSWQFRRVGPEDWENGARLMKMVEGTKGLVLFDRHHGFLLAAGKRAEYDEGLIWWLEQRASLRSMDGIVRDIRVGRYERIFMSEWYMLPEIREALEAGYMREGERAVEFSGERRFGYRFIPWSRREASSPPPETREGSPDTFLRDKVELSP